VRPSVCLRMRPVSRMSYKSMLKFHQTSVDDVVQAACELVRFSRSLDENQGHDKVKYLSQLLWWGIEVSFSYFLYYRCIY